VGAMVRRSAELETTFEVRQETSPALMEPAASAVAG